MTPHLSLPRSRVRFFGHRGAVRAAVSGVTAGAVVLGLMPFAAPAAARDNSPALPKICVEEPEVDPSPSPSASASPSASPSSSSSPSVESSSSSPVSDDGVDESTSEPSLDEAGPSTVVPDESDQGGDSTPSDEDAVGQVITSATVADSKERAASVCPPSVGGLRAVAGLGRVQLEWEFAFATEVSESVVVRAGELLVAGDGDTSAAGESEGESVAPSSAAVGDGEGGESGAGDEVDPSPSASVSPSLEVSTPPSPSPSPSPSASPSASASPSPSVSPSVRPVRSAPPVERFVVVVLPGDRVIEVSSGERSALVSGLRNGTQYSFTVFAVSELGRGPGETVTATLVTGMEGEVAGVLVKFTGDVTDARSVPGADRVDVVDLQLDREVADDVHLVEFSDAVDAVTAEQIAQELQADPGVEWAEPDQFVFITQTDAGERAPPDDPLFAQEQWNLWGDYGVGVAEGPGSVNPAWSPDVGAGVTVGVIDTGITNHPDLVGQTVAGYDFVSNPAGLAAPREPGGALADFDGDDQPGWDTDPTDPGDWRGVAPVRASTWHGTHIAGIIAARAANGEGITGLAPGARIQPVRAISWRGGLLSDITAAITWASGGTLPGVPANSTPSKVLNLSFTLQSPCTPALQAAITGANTRGSVVIAAAGNANDDVAGYAPANCARTIAVAATDRDGKRAPYSNYGTGIDLAAPGGSLTGNTGVLSTSNPGYATREGTSIAAAHVTALTTRIVAANPTATPTDIRNQLTTRQAVRPFPNNTCDTDTTKTCGTGIAAFAQPVSLSSIGTSWQLHGDADELVANWMSVAYGNGRFVAVSRLKDRSVMSSADGVNWTVDSRAPHGPWFSVTHGGGVFVAVGYEGATEESRVMRSVDGLTWTLQKPPPSTDRNFGWLSVTHGDCQFTAGSPRSTCFVAVGGRGSGNRVMTSSDGTVWTSGNSVANHTWRSVTFGKGIFVAVGDGAVMTSSNGVSWQTQTLSSALQRGWMSVTFGDGLFVAVSLEGKVMTSTSGTTWTERATGVLCQSRNCQWRAITYGDGTFVAVAPSGVMTSPDGITWADRINGVKSPGNGYPWFGVTFGRGLFVAVSEYRRPSVMTSGSAPAPPLGVAATPSDSQATVSWQEPATGGYEISSYTVRASPGGQSCTTSEGTSCTVTGLTNGTPYTFTVTASNSEGTSLSSNASSAVTPRIAASGGSDAPEVAPASQVSSADETPGGSRRPPLAAEQLVVRRPGNVLVRVVRPGGAGGAVSDGVDRGADGEGELPVVVVPLPGRDGKVIRALSWDVELQGVEETGSPAPLNASGNLEVVQGRGLATSGRGFAPGSAVGVYLFSEPRTLGTLTTDARGVFSGVVPVPGDVPVGVHTAQVSGYTPEGDILIVSLGIEVAAPQADPLVNPVPSRVQPLWWIPVTDASGEVVVSAGSSGCSAVDGSGSPSRGRALVFWNTGTCIFEVRSGGKTWKSFRVPIVPSALKTQGVQELATRRVWFTSSGSVRGKSAEMLADAVPRMQSSPASYAYWVDSKDKTIHASTTRQHATLAKRLTALGPVRGIRTITPTKPWAAIFPPDTSNYILIAWKP